MGFRGAGQFATNLAYGQLDEHNRRKREEAERQRMATSLAALFKASGFETPPPGLKEEQGLDLFQSLINIEKVKKEQEFTTGRDTAQRTLDTGVATQKQAGITSGIKQRLLGLNTRAQAVGILPLSIPDEQLSVNEIAVDDFEEQIKALEGEGRFLSRPKPPPKEEKPTRLNIPDIKQIDDVLIKEFLPFTQNQVLNPSDPWEVYQSLPDGRIALDRGYGGAQVGVPTQEGGTRQDWNRRKQELTNKYIQEGTLGLYSGIPTGSKIIGTQTSTGKPVYELPDGTYRVE